MPNMATSPAAGYQPRVPNPNPAGTVPDITDRPLLSEFGPEVTATARRITAALG
jgi:hypothetical protein